MSGFCILPEYAKNLAKSLHLQTDKIKQNRTMISYCRKGVWVALVSTMILLNHSCGKKADVVIEGSVSNLQEKAKVVLLLQEFSRVIPIDSVEISPRKETFRFSLRDVQEPTFLHLRLGSKKAGVAVLLVEKDEKLRIDVDANAFNQYQVSGSPGSELTKVLSDKLSETVRTLDSLNRLIKRTAIIAEKERINMEYVAAIDSQRAFSSRFIIKNAMSRASLMAVYQQYGENHFIFDRAEDLYLLKVVGTSLKAFYPESEFTKGVLTDIKRQEAKLSAIRMSQLVAEAENSLPEISLPNIQGDTVRLSSLRGKVILLSFWASHDQASLFENQEMKGVYQTYKPKGFEIFQVSLDVNREAWVAKVKSTDLPWINVSELSPSPFTARIYNVTSIPSNYLINKNFEIVGKNLSGKDLERKIKELI